MVKLEDVDSRIDKSISFSDGKYSIDLPKKENAPVLSYNYTNARNRFLSLEKRFQSSRTKEGLYRSLK